MRISRLIAAASTYCILHTHCHFPFLCVINRAGRTLGSPTSIPFVRFLPDRRPWKQKGPISVFSLCTSPYRRSRCTIIFGAPYPSALLHIQVEINTCTSWSGPPSLIRTVVWHLHKKGFSKWHRHPFPPLQQCRTYVQLSFSPPTPDFETPICSCVRSFQIASALKRTEREKLHGNNYYLGKKVKRLLGIFSLPVPFPLPSVVFVLLRFGGGGGKRH